MTAGLLALTPVRAGAQAALPPLNISLRQLLDSVSASHPMLSISQSRIDVARGDRSAARAFSNPVLSYQVENAKLPGGSQPMMERETMTMLMLPLEPIYQRGPNMRRADAALRAAESDSKATRQTTALNAAHSFYGVALAQVAVESVRDLAGWLDSVVAYNRSRFEEGAVAELDLMRAELERDRTRATLTLRESDHARASADLRGLLTGTDTHLRKVAVTFDALPLGIRATSDNSVESLTATALQLRPEMLASRERLAASNAGIGAERSLFIRELGAVIGTKQTDGPTSFIGGISFPIPLFDQNRGAVTRAKAERAIASAELADMQRTVTAEVRGAAESARLLTDRLRSLSSGATNFLSRADEARRIAFAAYREGAVPLTQVIDAAHAWSDSRIAFHELLFAQHEAVLALNVAVGADILNIALTNTPSGSPNSLRNRDEP